MCWIIEPDIYRTRGKKTDLAGGRCRCYPVRFAICGVVQQSRTKDYPGKPGEAGNLVSGW